MTKMKKLFAVVLALAMLFTMAGFSASATTPTVTVSVEPQEVIVGDTVEVKIALTDLGGVDGTLTYDKDCFEYQSITFEKAAVNNEQNSLDKKEGSLHLILVGGGATLTFKATKAADNAEFKFAVNAASNETGTDTVENIPDVSDTVTVSETPVPFVLGAQLRAQKEIADQDLAFTAEIRDLAKVGDDKITEIGLIVIPTALLKTYEVNDLNDFILDNDKISAKILTAKLDVSENTDLTGKFIGYIKGSISRLELMGKKFTARYYIKLESGKVIYSTNDNYNESGNEKVVTLGTTESSAVRILGTYVKAIKNNATAPETIKTDAETVINNYNTLKSDPVEGDNVKKALLQFVANNKQYLKTNG